jgi:hypothetical protein
MHEGLQVMGAQVDMQPWSFAEFEQRRTRVVSRRRLTTWSVFGSAAAASLVILFALLTQPSRRIMVDEQKPAISAGALVAGHSASAPALVDLSQFDITSELEDRIALLDAQLSTARVQAAPFEQLVQMESTREQLNNSLQSVSYAHSLLSL